MLSEFLAKLLNRPVMAITSKFQNEKMKLGTQPFVRQDVHQTAIKKAERTFRDQVAACDPWCGQLQAPGSAGLGATAGEHDHLQRLRPLSVSCVSRPMERLLCGRLGAGGAGDEPDDHLLGAELPAATAAAAVSRRARARPCCHVMCVIKGDSLRELTLCE